MITVKQLERTWTAKQYQRLYGELVACRPEAEMPVDFEAGWNLPAAAMAIIRMEELSQSHVPLCRQLLRLILAAQLPEGSWGDLTVTALCLRALLCGQGEGLAIDRGMDFLKRLQKPDGLWPKYPHERMPEDAAVSAFIAYELGDQPAFQAAVRMDDLTDWFTSNEPFLNGDARELWNRAARRCAAPARVMAQSWS